MKHFLLFLILIMSVPVVHADDTTTISRSKLLHPNLGHVPGANTHAHIVTMYETLGDGINSRFFTEAALADTASVDFDHNFFADFDQLRWALYIHNTGTDELTTVTDVSTPSLADFTIAATGGDLKRQITVTNNSGGPEDIALVVVHDGGVTLPTGSLQWTKFTFDDTDLSDADTSQDIIVLTFPVSGVVSGVVIKHSTGFAGPSCTSLTVSLGITGDVTKYASAFEIEATANPVADASKQSTNVLDSEFGGPVDIIGQFNSVGCNLSAFTSGSVDIWVQSTVLP